MGGTSLRFAKFSGSGGGRSRDSLRKSPWGGGGGGHSRDTLRDSSCLASSFGEEQRKSTSPGALHGGFEGPHTALTAVRCQALRVWRALCALACFFTRVSTSIQAARTCADVCSSSAEILSFLATGSWSVSIVAGPVSEGTWCRVIPMLASTNPECPTSLEVLCFRPRSMTLWAGLRPESCGLYGL